MSPSKQNHSAQQSDPYTTRFAPLKEWPKLTEKLRAWFRDSAEDENGLTNEDKMEDRAIGRAGRSKFEKWSNYEFENAVASEAFYEFKLRCPKDSNLPPPERDKTYGYSWTAWCLAAQKAGTCRRSFSFKECAFVVDSCIEYWHSQIIEWKDNPDIFTIHVREICQPILDASLFSADLLDLWDPHITMLNRRVRDVFEVYCYWRKIKSAIVSLKELGLAEGGKRATNQALSPGPIQDEYAKLQRTVSHLQTITEKALQMAFIAGRGRTLIEPYSDVPFMDRFENYTQGNLYCLTRPILELRKTSYLDYLLAGLCGLTGRGEKDTHSFWHYLLEYEQELPKHPEWPKMIGSHMQRLIGESAMISDAILTTAWITKEGDYLKKAAQIDFYSEMRPQVDVITKIFGYHTPAIKEFEVTYEMPNDIGERLWRHWNMYSKSIYGKDLTELFELNNNDQQDAKWSPQAEQIGVVEMGNNIRDGRLVQSGHSYSQSQVVDGSRGKIKSRPEVNNAMDTHRVQVEYGLLEEDCEDMTVTSVNGGAATNGRQYTFTVNNKQMKLVGRLFSSAAQVEGQGQVRWDDIYKLMKRIGFRIEEVGGSIIRFVPPNNAGIPFSEHRPHPETNLHAVRYRAFGERLRRRYGWSIDWFERVKQDD